MLYLNKATISRGKYTFPKVSSYQNLSFHKKIYLLYSLCFKYTKYV